MDPRQYFRGIKRRWYIVIVALAAGLAAGFFLSPTAKAQRKSAPATTYVTTVIMLTNLPEGEAQRYAVLTRIGEIPQRVASAMQFEGNPRRLASRIRVLNNDTTHLFRIIATSPDQVESKKLADTFASELLAWRNERHATDRNARLESLGRRMEELKGEIAQLDSQIGGGNQFDVVRAERDAKVRRYGVLYENYQAAAATSEGAGGIEILDSGDPIARRIKDESPATSALGTSRWARTGTGGLIGLFAGLSLALLLERFDTRIQTRDQAQDHFDQPVLAEIPRIGWGKRSNLKATTRNRDTRIDDAFRVLAAASTRRQPKTDDRSAHQTNGSGDGRGRVILVTSAGQDEGKTTVVANLARTFALMGKTVTALSCDFRRPALHQLFRIRNNWGLTDVLRSNEPLNSLNGKVPAPFGISVIPIGGIPSNPAELLESERMRNVLAVARAESEIVLIDSAPILTGDAPHLFGAVDAVLVVARAGETRAEVAHRAADLVKRLDAPVIGLVLNAATERLTPGYGPTPKHTVRRKGKAKVRRGISPVPRPPKRR
jgi:capsular exopolysaccharide synthesis family protein